MTQTTIEEGKLPTEFKAKWIEALRSGKYKQGKEKLFNNGAFCCLGVACLVNGYKESDLLYPDGDDSFAYIIRTFDKMPQILFEGDSKSLSFQLADMNDSGKSFSEIADWIESNL